MTGYEAPPLDVRVDDLHKRYRRRTHALRGVSLHFGPGVSCLLGRNGAGKSTLVRQITGIEKPTSGSVQFSLGDRTEFTNEVPQRHLGWLPQVFGFPGGMRAVDYVAYAAWLKGVGRSEARALADEAIEFAGLRNVASKRLSELSGGTLRRAGLAAAVVHRPSGLVFDEPTAGLDPVQRDDFHRRVSELGARTSILVATHLLEDVQALAQRIYVLDEGQLLWEGSPAELARVGRSARTGVDGLRVGLIELIGGSAS